jgi:phosphoenolpyruvate synthase/pyruvate phosphate dikinase
MLQPELSGDFATIMQWADSTRRMKVRANAETPADARMARSFGAEGIGLCRTEHMFFDGRPHRRRARDDPGRHAEAGRAQALAKLLPMQRSDFVELFEIMAGLPVTIRLLDPPLHEFLPQTDEEIAEVAAAMGVRPTCCASAPRRCTSSTRCWAIAAAAWRSPIPRSPRCRPAPSSRRRSRRPQEDRPTRSSPRSWCRWWA